MASRFNDKTALVTGAASGTPARTRAVTSPGVTQADQAGTDSKKAAMQAAVRQKGAWGGLL